MARVLFGHPDGVKSNTVNSLAGQYHTSLIAAVSWEYQKQPQRRLYQDSNKNKQVNRRLTKQRKMVEYLIKQGGDPKIKGGRYGTMLSAAAAKSKPDLVTYVLDEVGFEVDEVDHEGRSAAHMACSRLNLRDAVDTFGTVIQEGW